MTLAYAEEPVVDRGVKVIVPVDNGSPSSVMRPLSEASKALPHPDKQMNPNASHTLLLSNMCLMCLTFLEEGEFSTE